MSSTPCYRHPLVSATRGCGDCFQPICAGCAVLDEGHCRCPECAALHGRRRTQRLTVSVLAALAVLGVGGYLGARSLASSPPEPTFDYGPKRALVLSLRTQLAAEPCDRTRAVQYAQTLFSAEDWRGGVQFADDFITRCGKFPQLRSISYSSHMRLSEFEPAVRDATELVESAPNNVSYRIWRALAHQSRGEAARALEDFQEAFRLQPEEFQVANQLATAYEKARQPCEAYRVLVEHQRANPKSLRRMDVLERLGTLEAQGHCGAAEGGVKAPPPRP